MLFVENQKTNEEIRNMNIDKFWLVLKNLRLPKQPLISFPISQQGARVTNTFVFLCACGVVALQQATRLVSSLAWASTSKNDLLFVTKVHKPRPELKQPSVQLCPL
eukprot:m.308190 g.308190  ORF g.308190 m.308190 type:complete len:106 (+) comp16472_c0_seq27:96-413(+)